MTSRRALVCAPLLPEFDRESGSRRVFDLIMFLREEGWAVSFVAQNVAGGERYVRSLQQCGVAVYAGFEGQFDELVAAAHFDVAIFAFWHIAELHMATLRSLSPVTRIIVDTIDLHFVRHARRIFTEAAGNGRGGVLDLDYAAEMVREVNTYAAADGALALSQKEADLIADLTGEAGLAYVVQDAEDVAPADRSFAERSGITFVGNFRHPPNRGAVQYLCKDILPRLDPAVLAEHPVYIVGNALDDEIRGHADGLAGVYMVGWVPSVLPYLQHARLSVVPLLYGAGTKRKLVQALMMGTPTVSTSVGIEGLNLLAGEHVLVADDPAGFANAMMRLLYDEELWQRIAQRGQAHVAPVHDREAVRARLMDVMAAVLAKEPKSTHLGELPLQLNKYESQRKYQQLIQRLRNIVRTTVPTEATVLVVSKGDDELLKLDGRRAWHFPQTVDGVYAGHYPKDSAAAIAHVEALRAKGADFLLLPQTAFWWLDHYAGLKQHLEHHYTVVAHEEDTCVIFAVGGPVGQHQGGANRTQTVVTELADRVNL